METTTSDRETKLEEFLSTKYKHQLNELSLLFPQAKSLNVDYQALDEYSPEIADELLEKPHEIIEVAERAVENMSILSSQGEMVTPHVRFYNLPEPSRIMIRDITASKINKFISLEGVINKIITVKPKITNAVFKCNSCERVYTIEQNAYDANLRTPGECVCGKRFFSLLTEDSDFTDIQKAEIQEPLELMRGGEQSKTITVWLRSDLTNKLVAGDKIEITGTVLLNMGKKKSSIYDLFIDVNHVTKLEQEFEELQITEEDEEWIKQFSKDPKLFQKIIASVAPSIFGHEQIKEAITLQLFHR